MVINSKVYIPKLTEQREILNILKSGDVNLMNPLFDSMRTLFKIYNKELTRYNTNDIMKLFLKEVKFFYSYKSKKFTAKIFIDDDNYIRNLQSEEEVNYKTDFIFDHKENYANLGEDILILRKIDTKKLHKMFFNTKVNKENKKEEVLNFLTDKVSQDVLKETSKMDVVVKDLEREFKKLFKSCKINLEYARADHHWNEFILKMFKNEIYDDLSCGCGYLFFDNPESLNYYKIGIYSSLINDKEFAELIFKENVLFDEFSKEQDCYISSGYKPLLVLMGLLLLSSTITSLSKKRKFELLSELIPEEDIVFSGKEQENDLFYCISYFFGENFNSFMINGANTFIYEVKNLLYYLIDKNIKKAQNLVTLVEKILKENLILEDLLVVGNPSLLADFFLLKEKIKNKQKNKRFSGELLYIYTIVRYNMITEDVILNLKDVFNSNGIKVGFVFDKSLKDTVSDYRNISYLSKVSKKINQPIAVNFSDERNIVSNLSQTIETLKSILNVESNMELSLNFNFNRFGTVKLKNEIEIVLDNDDQLYSIFHILKGFCDIKLETWQFDKMFKVRKITVDNSKGTRYFSQIES